MTPDPTITVRAGIQADIPAVLAIELQTPASAHWSEHQYRSLLSGGTPLRLLLVAETTSSREIIGFLVACHIPPDWELENVAVAPNSQRQGIANRLLAALLNEIKEEKGEAVFLEVRESNAPARAFYERAGFRQTGRRKSYYSNPQEDAILYRLTLR